MNPNYEKVKEYTSIKEMHKYCADQIRTLKKSKKFYLRWTNNPSERLEEHVLNEKMKNMHVLAKCNKKHATILKKHMDKIFLKQNKCQNNQEVIDELEEGDCYLYLLFK